MSSHSFPARYRTVCATCDEWIAAGESIVMTADGAEHLVCAADDHESPEACPTCWLIHPEGACDR